MLKNQYMLTIGIISMALGILVGRFVQFEFAGFSGSSFVEGMLIGLSITMNLAYVIRTKRKINLNS